MSETEYTGPENYSLAEEWFDDTTTLGEPTPYDPADAYDGYDRDQLAEYAGDEEAEEYVEPSPDYPPDLEQMVAEAMRQGASSAEAMLEARQRADAWWNDYRARSDYENHVQEYARYQEADALADELIRDAAERHNVEQSGRDGTLYQVANAMMAQDRQLAFNSGDTAQFEWLGTPEAAEAAIERAAELAHQEGVIHSTLWGRGLPRVLDGLQRTPDGIEWAQKTRSEFDAYMHARGERR